MSFRDLRIEALTALSKSRKNFWPLFKESLSLANYEKLINTYENGAEREDMNIDRREAGPLPFDHQNHQDMECQRGNCIRQADKCIDQVVFGIVSRTLGSLPNFHTSC